MHYSKPKDRDLNIDAACDHWVGDPCYVVPEEYWGALCANWSAYDNKHGDDADYKPHYVAKAQDENTGTCFHLWSTAWGDGTYPLFVNDNKVADLGVDAGTLSVIPMSLIEHWNKQGCIGDYQDMGHVVEAEHLRGELICEGGDFTWGALGLPTGDMVDEDEYDPYEDEFEC